MGGLFNGQNMVLASGALNSVGSIASGHAAGKYLEYQGAQATADAQAERELGIVRSGRVRKAGALVRNEALGAQGASGSSVNSKSAEEVRTYIDRSSETDALMELYGGQRRGAALDANAAGYRAQAGLARNEGAAGAGRSLLSSAGKVYAIQQEESRWLKRRPTTYGDTYSMTDPAYG